MPDDGLACRAASRLSLPIALCFLLLSACLEAGGDAAMRVGIHGPGPRLPWLLGGASLLFAYGCMVNAPAWDFGRLLGVYVVFFFLVAQAIAWLAFHQPPSPRLILGGVFILAGGLIVASGGK
jgi:small multidrug resistance family-3 protein